MKYFMNVFVFTLTVMLISCTPPLIKTDKNPLTTTESNDVRANLNPRLDPRLEVIEEGINNEWGLALSGGGVRSALFSIGVLKGLEKKGKLKNINIISSVSGGGYAAYWLFSDPDLNKNEFGHGQLFRENFPMATCKILTTGNFVSYPAILGKFYNPVGLYKNSIFRTFSSGLDKNASIRDSNIINVATGSASRVPYHIVNTTRIDKDLPWKHQFFEFTPLGYGNYLQNNGLNSWAASGSDVKYLESIAISGAAHKGSLKQTLSLDIEGKVESVTLSDGGHSENLGAYSLIRRGVKNIIIVDAEHNPNYEFSAYKLLKLQLADDGFEFSIPEIDQFIQNQTFYTDSSIDASKLRLQKAAYVGSVKDVIGKRPHGNGGSPYEAKIFYIKMAATKSIENLINNQAPFKIDYSKGKTLNNRAYDYLKNEAAKKKQKEWDCGQLNESNVPEIGEENALENWFGYVLDSYMTSFPSFSRVKLLNRTKIDFLKSDFPQYTTGDQSFYHDQAVAFMALGYFATNDLSFDH